MEELLALSPRPPLLTHPPSSAVFAANTYTVQVVGHEIVGEAVRVGSEVKHVKVGDIVGVGAQNDSCLKCGNCQADKEPYCDEGQVGTYAGVYKKGNGKGDKSYGGYADYHRAPGHFVIPIPDGLDPAMAAPMLCGGVTVS